MKNPHKYRREISKDSFCNTLKTLYGLELDMDMICRYIDTYPQNESTYNYKSPRVFTIDLKDSTGYGWANIKSKFYKEHTTKKTELFKEFKHFIDSHTFKIGNYWYNG